MKFDKHDTPEVRPQGVEAGPSSQLPVSGNPSSAVGDGLMTIGKAAAQFSEAQARADAFRAADADNSYAGATKEIVDEHKLKQGANALDTASVHQALEEARLKIAGTLKGGAEKEFGRKSVLRAITAKQAVESHATDQRRALEAKIVEGSLKTARDQAVANFTLPDKVEEQIGVLLDPKGVFQLQLNDLGLTGKAREDAIRSAETAIYEGVLGAYKENKMFASGLAYINDIEDTIGATKASAWRSAFREYADKAEVEHLSTEAWAVVSDNATDPVTGRFNPDLAKSAFETLYAPDVRARIETEVTKEIDLAISRQNEADKQKVARLVTGVIKTGRVDRLSGDYTNLDDDGRLRVEAAVRTYQRERRSDDAQARREQADLDSIAESQFFQIPSVEERAALATDLSQIDGMFPDASTKMREKIKKHVVAASIIAKKGQEASHKEFLSQVNGAKKALDGTRSKAFDDHMQAWYNGQVLLDKIPTDKEVIQHINEKLRMRETWGSNEYDFELEMQGLNPSDYKLADYQPSERARAALAQPVPLKKPTAAAAPKTVSGADLLKRFPGQPIDPNATYEQNGNTFRKVK